MSKMIITLKEGKKIEIELFDDAAPLAVEGMKRIASLGKYNHHRIERLEPDFVIQPLFFDGVDSDIDRMIPLEAKHQDQSVYYFDKYTLGMAGDDKEASGSQFFICMSRQKRLDGLFTVAGKVTSGFDVADALDQSEVVAVKDENGYTYHAPKEDIIIESIVICR